MTNAEFSERGLKLFNKNFVVNVVKMLSRVIICIVYVNQELVAEDFFSTLGE